MQALRAKGAGKVIVSEVAERRKEYATEFGADIILDPSKEDVVARVKELTDNVGVAVVYDCAGMSAFRASALAGYRSAFWSCLRLSLLIADHIFRLNQASKSVSILGFSACVCMGKSFLSSP